MPQAISVSEIERNFIRKVLQKTFEFALADSNDCKKLSELIADKTGFAISYNTLRRFLKIVSSNGSCALFSLNIIALSIDFKDWNTLQEHISEYEISYQNHLIQLFRKERFIEHELGFSVITRMGFTDWKEAYWLKLIIQMALEFDDYDFFEKLFQLPIDVNDPAITDKLYFAFQDIYSHIPRNEKLRELICRQMDDSVIIQQIIMMCYVDENGMGSHYGKLLEKFKDVFKNDEQQQLFYQLIQLQSMYAKKRSQVEVKKKFREAIDTFEKCDQKNLSPIVKGRIAAWQWIIDQEDDFYKEFVEHLKAKPAIGHFIDFFNRLTILFELPYFKLLEDQKLMNLFKQEFPKLSFFNETIYNQVKLGFAINLYLQNNRSEAKKWFLQASPFIFDITMYDWYDNWYRLLEVKLFYHEG